MQEIAWGVVQSTGPTEVRFAGDSADVPIALKDAALTVSVGQKVLLAKAGSRDGWVIVCVIGASV